MNNDAQNQAEKIYSTMCDVLQNVLHWNFRRDDEKMHIFTTAVGKDLSMPLHIIVSAQRKLAYVKSPMPFSRRPRQPQGGGAGGERGKLFHAQRVLRIQRGQRRIGVQGGAALRRLRDFRRGVQIPYTSFLPDDGQIQRQVSGAFHRRNGFGRLQGVCLPQLSGGNAPLFDFHRIPA